MNTQGLSGARSQQRFVIPKVMTVFAVGGAISGLCFATLISLPILKKFWFVKTDKFLVPTIWYWLGFIASLAIAIIACHRYVYRRGWLTRNAVQSISEAWFTVVLMTTCLLIYFISAKMRTLLGSSWEWFFAPIVFLSLFTLAVGILTKGLRWFVALFGTCLLVAVIGGIGTLGVLNALGNMRETFSIAVQWALISGTLTIAFAVCLIISAGLRNPNQR